MLGRTARGRNTFSGALAVGLLAALLLGGCKKDPPAAPPPTTTTTTKPAAGGPDLSSPKSAARAYKAALQRSDVAGAKQCVLDEPAHQKKAEAVVAIVGEFMRLDAAARERFGQSIRSEGNPKVTFEVPNPDAVNYAKVEDDGQYATVTPDGGGKVRVKKVGDQWKVDLTDEKATAPEHLLKEAALALKISAELAKVTQAVRDDEFTDVNGARTAVVGVLFVAVFGEADTQPATTQSATTGPSTRPNGQAD